MEPIRLEIQQADPVDDATRQAVEEGQAALRRGEIVSQEQSRINARERYHAWRKTQEELAVVGR